MDKTYILAIDNGTQSVRALLFDLHGNLVDKSQVGIDSYRSPEPGWVENDADAFWHSLCTACQRLWANTRVPKDAIAGAVIAARMARVPVILAGGLAPALGRPLAIALSTLAFAVLHIEPARMVATAILGGVAGVLAMRGGSIWPAVALHATNNLIVALIGAGALPGLAAVIDQQPGAAIAAAAALTLAGGALAWTGTITPPHRARE